MVDRFRYGSMVDNSCGVESGVVGMSSSDIALDMFREYVRDYLFEFGFTTTFNDLVLHKTGVDDSNISVKKQLIFLKFSMYSLESGYVDPVQLELQYFGLYVKGIDSSDIRRNEKLNVLESWVEQCEQKYGDVDVSCMRQEIEILKNS